MTRRKRQIKLGVGFVTGRKNFRNLVKTYASNWHEHDLTNNINLEIHLFVAYDLKYSNTKASDYTKIEPEIIDLVDSITFISKNRIKTEKRRLIEQGLLNARETKLLFGDGYGKKRNAVVYFAKKAQMDYLIFLDDDEYPLAPIKTAENSVTWRGQSVVSTHLQYIDQAEITHGHHCGYISPIPQIQFNEQLTEADFRVFIESISNDIISWDSIKSKMANGGVTFADSSLLDNPRAVEVPEINGAKFISGSNLCLNLHHADRIAPFYNPPGARGEDTFLGTCLSKLKVLKVPTYTFHDGFLRYTHLLHGVLPGSLTPVTASSPAILTRFLRACIGWIRYKPLLLYITEKPNYEAKISQMRDSLARVVPKLCRYFGIEEFARIQSELEHYHKNVQRHYDAFTEARQAWEKVMKYIQQDDFMASAI